MPKVLHSDQTLTVFNSYKMTDVTAGYERDSGRFWHFQYFHNMLSCQTSLNVMKGRDVELSTSSVLVPFLKF